MNVANWKGDLEKKSSLLTGMVAFIWLLHHIDDPTIYERAFNFKRSLLPWRLLVYTSVCSTKCFLLQNAYKPFLKINERQSKINIFNLMQKPASLKRSKFRSPLYQDSRGLFPSPSQPAVSQATSILICSF